MSENYIVINGKKAELTKEQLKVLGIEPEKKRKNPFDRVHVNDEYFAMGHYELATLHEANDWCDDSIFEAVNYFNNKAFAKQVALRQLLYRKLLKFAYDNECEDMAEWNENNTHWLVIYDTHYNTLIPYWQKIFKAQEVYFSTKEGADRAIKEVVEPFMKEHPDFVW